MMDVKSFFLQLLPAEEGGYSDNLVDAGNWFQPGATVQRTGVGRFIGSNHGVTGAVLAAHRNNPNITADDMRALSYEEAAEIAVDQFYHAPGWASMPWDPIIASAVDFGWGAGPFHGVIIIQGLAGVPQDGRIGPATLGSYRAWIARLGLEAAAQAIETARDHYYDAVIARRPANEVFRKGWYNRSHHFSYMGAWWVGFMA